MRRRGFAIARWVVIAGAFLGTASGQEITLDGFAGLGARAMGMGGAYTAISSDFTGLFWNPAGLARAASGEAYTSFSHENTRNQTRFFGAPSAHRLSSSRLNAIGFVAPYPVHQGSLVLAGGYGKTESLDAGLRIQGYDTAAGFEKEGFSEDRGALGAYVAGGAIDVARGASAGVSLQVWRGSSEFRQELTQSDTREAHGDTVSLFQRFASSNSYSGLRLRAGLLYDHPSGFRFGLTVASPMTLTVDAAMADEYEDVLVDRTLSFPTERFSDAYSVRYPFEFGAGISWENARLLVSGEAVYADLESVTYSDPPQAATPQVDDFRVEYRSAVRTGLGVELKGLDGRAAVRAGYYRDPVRYAGGGSGPAIRTVNDRDAFAFGLGGLLERTVSLDIAMTISGYRQIEGNREDHVRSLRVFASTGYRWR